MQTAALPPLGAPRDARSNTPRALLIAIANLIWLAACDPIHVSHTSVDLPRREIRTGIAATGLADADLADATAIVDGVAAQFSFQRRPLAEASKEQGWQEEFAMKYAFDPGLYREVTIATRVQPQAARFEVDIWEFVADRESELGKRVRVAITAKLVARFGADAVHSDPD